MDPQATKKLVRLNELQSRLQRVQAEKQAIEHEIEKLLGYDFEPSEPRTKFPVKCRLPDCKFRGWGAGLSKHYRETGH
jgi:hypothetical protein